MACYDTQLFKLRRALTVAEPNSPVVDPAVIPRDQHCISRADIADSALKVLYRLHDAGFRACLVGGGVRDLLLGLHPKDFDVATDATPEQVRELFRNSRIIGRRFKLVHVRFGREIIEVATFRGNAGEDQQHLNEHGRILHDNAYGSIEEDALRRDFSVNALYYDIANFSVIDYVGGMQDIQSRKLRLIGEVEKRYLEDPVRMLRAVRFAVKLDFSMEPEVAAMIAEHGHLLSHIPAARLFDEMLKLFHAGKAFQSYEALRQYDLFQYLFPETDAWLKRQHDERMLDFIDRALINTDDRVRADKPVSPAFIYAVMLWPVLQQRISEYPDSDLPAHQKWQNLAAEILTQQVQATAVPKRFSLVSRDIWLLQLRFEKTRGKQPARLHAHPAFRAAYDFMCLQASVGLVNAKLCQWWTEFQQQNQAPEQQPKPTQKRRPRRRRSKNNGPDTAENV